MHTLERNIAITGLGQSQVGRRLERSGLDLTVEAALDAIADADLSPEDIDGLATYPGAHPAPGFAPTGVYECKEALGLRLGWFLGAPQVPGQFGVVLEAIMAVTFGLASHVLCFRTVCESSAQGSRSRGSVLGTADRLTDHHQWLHPFGAMSPANWLAMYAQRYFHEYGTTREQLSGIARSARRHAGRNPAAIYREPMSLDDYLSARMISSPLCLYDCDVPVDGSTAIVVSRRDSAGPRAIAVEAMGAGLRDSYYWDQRSDLTTMAAHEAAQAMWARTDLGPEDVDVAQLYDGFSIITLAWLEALGFCGPGEAAAFVSDPDRLDLDGELPLNTQGGQLSGGRLHGFGFLHEACVQLRGEAGDRQVPGRPKVAVAAAGGGPLGSCLLLTR